jgi:cytochrome P450
MLSPFEFLESCARRYGDLFTLRMVVFGTYVCASHPATIKQIFTGDPDELRVGEGNESLRPLIGDHSILLMDGERHLLHRRLMLPLFHGERAAAYAAVMHEVAARAVDAWPEGKPIALHPEAQRITLEVILRCLLGMDEGADLDALRDALEVLLRRSSPVEGAMLMTPALQRDLGPFTPWAALRRDIDRVDALLYRLIARRRREPVGGARPDVLGGLLDEAAAANVVLNDAEIRDELMTLIIAGHETTATTLCWAIESLLGEPAITARLVAELTDLTGGGPLRPEHVAAADYLDATVKEALRMHPVVPILGVGRVLKSPLRVQGYELPAGVKLTPVIHLVHRRPDLYPDPDRFLPDRFLGKKLDPYEFLPFGGGVRRCLGMAFALQELRTVLATILLRVRLASARTMAPRPVLFGVTITPFGGTRVLATRVRSSYRAREVA